MKAQLGAAIARLGLLKAGGPYIGPKGGLWADPQHTIHWEEPVHHVDRPATTPVHEHPANHVHEDYAGKLDRIMDYEAACGAHRDWSNRLKVAHDALKSWDDDFANRPVRDTARMKARLDKIQEALASGHKPSGEMIHGVLFESVASATGSFAVELSQEQISQRRSALTDFEASKPGFKSYLKKLYRERLDGGYGGMIIKDDGGVLVVGLRGNNSHQLVLDENVPEWMRKSADEWRRLHESVANELVEWSRLPSEHHALAAKAGLRVSPILTPGNHALISGDANTSRPGGPVIRLFNSSTQADGEHIHSVLCHEFGHVIEGVINNARNEKAPSSVDDWVKGSDGRWGPVAHKLADIFKQNCTPPTPEDRRGYWDQHGWGSRAVEWFAEAYRYAYGEMHGRVPDEMSTNLGENGFDRGKFRAWVDAHVARALRGDVSVDNAFTERLSKALRLFSAIFKSGGPYIGTNGKWAEPKITKALESMGLSMLAPQDMSSGVLQITGRRAYQAYITSMPDVTANGRSVPGWDALPEHVRDEWCGVGDGFELDDAGDEWRPMPDDEGAAVWASLLTKGTAHKYISRHPTGNPKRPWRYMYRYTHKLYRRERDGESKVIRHGTLPERPTSVVNTEDIVPGASFSDGVIGQHSGHWIVESVRRDDSYSTVVRHDTTGERREMGTWEFADMINAGHTAGIDEDTAKRQATRARLQDEVFDQIDEVIARGDMSEVAMKRMRTLDSYLRRLDGYSVTALARRYNVSMAPPANWAKARKEMTALRTDLEDYRLDDSLVNDHDKAAGLMWEPKALKQWIRLKTLDQWLDHSGLALSAGWFFDEVHNQLAKTNEVVPSDFDKTVRAALQTAGSKWVSLPLAEIRGVANFEQGFERFCISHPEMAGSKFAIASALDKRKVAAVLVTRYPTDSDTKKKAAELLARYSSTRAENHDRPETLAPVPSRANGDNPMVWVRGMQVPFNIAVKWHAENSEARKVFLAKHDRVMSRLSGVMSDVKVAVGKALEADFSGSLNPHDKVLKALAHELGVPSTAHESNAQKLSAPPTEALNVLRAASPDVILDVMPLSDRADAERLLKSVHPDVLPLVEIVHEPSMVGRSWCSRNHVRLTSNADRVTLWHEVGHAIEHESIGIAQAVHHFWLERSKESTRESLGSGYQSNEETYRDGWSHPYTGKVYDASLARSGYTSEVVSMGLQDYLHDPLALYQRDPEHFHLIAAVVSGRLGKSGDTAEAL